MESWLTPRNLNGSQIESLLTNAGSGRSALMIQMGGWEASVLGKLNTALETYSTLGSELIAQPGLLNHWYAANTQWWYKYALIREDHLAGNTLLPPGLRSSVEDLETLNGVRLSTVNPRNKLSDLGNLFEDDLIEEVGQGFRNGGNFDHLPPDVRQKMLDLYNNGYTIMITQSKVDLSPWFTKKPHPDMLFFKTTLNGRIQYTNAIYIDGKLSTSTGFTGAQKDLKSLAATNKQVSIFGFAYDKNPEIFASGNYDLETDFLNQTITIGEAGKVGTEYKNNIFNVTYKP